MGRMSFDDLASLQDDLDGRLVSGELDVFDWNRECDEVMSAAGWTQSQYEAEVDRRWEHLGALRRSSARHRSANN